MPTNSKRMRKLSAYILLLILIIACNDEKQETRRYTIQGNGVGTGKVYLFGSGDVHKQLSSTDCDNRFTMSIPLETNATLTLILPNEKTLTLFAEPGMTATLQADSILKSGWAVSGGHTQALHDSISRVLDATDNLEKRKKIIEEFTKKYPLSEVTVELFRRYLIEIPSPDNEYIKKAIGKLGGVIQDHEYFIGVKKLLDKKPGNVKNKLFPNFKYSTIDHGKVDQGMFAGKYLLVTFWDIWSDGSREYLKRLNEVNDSITGENFAILNIAIGSDTARIREIIEENNIVGNNAYDPQGMNSEVLIPFNMTSLPFSTLVTPYKRIEKYHLKLDSADIALIDSLVLKHDKKQKK